MMMKKINLGGHFFFPPFLCRCWKSASFFEDVCGVNRDFMDF